MKTAVLLLAHGTPDSPADVPAYIKNITGGRPIPDEVLKEVQHRYGIIGRSPLTDITMHQAAALSAQLEVPVYVGMRNWHPFIADVVKKMLADGVTHTIALCLAPHNSRTSVGLYRKALEQTVGDSLQMDFIEDWHDEPLLIDAFAERLAAALPKERTPIIFTAHSVPTATIDAGDPYDVQARHTGRLVAQRASLRDDDWSFAFQSQGMSGGAWIGPTVESTIDALHAQGARRILIQPIGFVCDHVEILYDIDIAFTQYAAERGIELTRTESLNTSFYLISALAWVLRARLATAVKQ